MHYQVKKLSQILIYESSNIIVSLNLRCFAS